MKTKESPSPWEALSMAGKVECLRINVMRLMEAVEHLSSAMGQREHDPVTGEPPLPNPKVET